MDQIRQITEHASSTTSVMQPRAASFENLDGSLDKTDALKMQEMLHKISILQIKRVKEIGTDEEEVYRQFTYLKPRIEDYFYL